MRVRLALSAVVVVALATSPGAWGSNPAQAFLIGAFGLSPSDVARVGGGHVVTRTLDTADRREVATLGIVRIRTTPAAYVERLLDIVAFKRTEDILEIAKFSSPPQVEDLATLTLEDADLKALRDCRVGDCGVRLGADDIARARRDIDWRAPDAMGRASGLVKQLLVDHVTRYRAGGAAGAVEYADRSPGLHVGREFASLVAADQTTWTHVPRLRRHLLEFPHGIEPGATDFVYWSKERVHRRAVVSITHVVVMPAAEASPVDYAIASKQIYAMHYFDASLGLTLLVRDHAGPHPATYVIYLNRSRIDLFEGLFGGIARRIVSGKARTLVGEQLARLQRTLAGA